MKNGWRRATLPAAPDTVHFTHLLRLRAPEFQTLAFPVTGELIVPCPGCSVASKGYTVELPCSHPPPGPWRRTHGAPLASFTWASVVSRLRASSSPSSLLTHSLWYILGSVPCLGCTPVCSLLRRLPSVEGASVCLYLHASPRRLLVYFRHHGHLVFPIRSWWLAQVDLGRDRAANRGPAQVQQLPAHDRVGQEVQGMPAFSSVSQLACWLARPMFCPFCPSLTSRNVSDAVCWHPSRWTDQEALSTFSPRLGSQLCSKTALLPDQSGPSLCFRRSSSSW